MDFVCVCVGRGLGTLGEWLIIGVGTLKWLPDDPMDG